MSQFIPAAEHWLSTNTSMPPKNQAALAELISTLLGNIPESPAQIITISGAPGTGKSTFAKACVSALAGDRIEAIVISLDDYYLSADQRKSLLANEHPLFSVRGVPGTHEIDWMIGHLKVLKNEGYSRLSLPQFDKSKDDRKSERLIISPDFKPQVIFLEGWIAGVPPQANGELLTAVNEFEELEDPDCEWRTRVNSYLYDYHEAYKGLAAQHWHLKAPDWASVIDWRLQQEISAGQGLLNSREEVCRFLDHYERLCKHMENTCSQWANSIIELDTNHFPTLVQLT